MSDVSHSKHEEDAKKEYLEDVFRNAYVNFNQIQEKRQTTDWKFPLTERTQFNLEITDIGINSQIAIRAVNAEHDAQTGDNEEVSSAIHIGHYDPGSKKFLFYKELIAEDDMDEIQDLAVEKRKTAIAERQTYDFDADIVSALYIKHREVLEHESLIYKIIEQYNTLPSQEKEAGVNEFHIDDSTTFFVGLAKSLKELKGVATDHFVAEESSIGIYFQGYLYKKNGVLQRKQSDILPLAFRDPNDMDGKFINNLDLILTKDFNRLLSLVHELEELRVTFYKNIDVHNLGLKKVKNELIG